MNALKAFFKELAKYKDIKSLPITTKKRLIKIFVKGLSKLFAKNENANISKLNTSLAQTYRTFIKTNYKLLNNGIREWRLKDIKPKMLKELENRIAQSSFLIKELSPTLNQNLKLRLTSFLNSENLDLSQVKKALSVNKELLRLNKRTQMIITDQTRKMLGSFNNIVAKEYDAIGFIWRGRRDIREVGNPAGLYPKGNAMHGDHWSRNGKFYFYPNCWAIKQGLINIKSKDFRLAKFHDGLPSEPINCRCSAYNFFDLRLIYLDISKDLLTQKGKDKAGIKE